MDIIIRYVKHYGYLGILVINDKEIYRTGNFKETSKEAFDLVSRYAEKYFDEDLSK